MSFLKRVSKRLQGDAFPNDLARTQDSVESSSDGYCAAAESSEKIWSISDFSVFHEVQKPIVVLSPGLFQKHDRWRNATYSACL